eukprot:SAG22_NODE_2_length_61565_cov_858.782010_71_plen_74_part_00
MARKFIKKCSFFVILNAKDWGAKPPVSFILPKNFKKESYQRSFPLNFHLMKQYNLDKNSFTIDGKTHDVPCVF